MEDKIFDMGKQKPVAGVVRIVGSISFGGYLLY